MWFLWISQPDLHSQRKNNDWPWPNEKLPQLFILCFDVKYSETVQQRKAAHYKWRRNPSYPFAVPASLRICNLLFLSGRFFKGTLLRSHLSISLSLYFFPPLLLPSPSYCSSKQTHETLESTLIIKVPIWSHKFMLSTFGEEKKNRKKAGPPMCFQTQCYKISILPAG